MNAKIWLLTSMSMAAYGVAEFLSKVWCKQPSVKLAIGASIFYLLNVVCWLFALRLHGKLAVLGSIYAALYVVITVAVGRIWFEERVEAVQWIGILLAIAAVILLSQE